VSALANSIARSAGALRAGWNDLSPFWRAQMVGWGLFAIVDVLTQRLIVADFSLALSRTALVLVCLVPISSLLRPVYASPTFGSRLTLRAVTVAALLSMAGGAVVAVVAFAIGQATGWETLGRTPSETFFLPFLHYSLALAGWSLCYFWIRAELEEQAEHRHAMRAEAEALRAELEELRLQLDPHFLFNALNGLAEEIPEHPQAALAMLRDLTAYLRHSLDGIHQTVVTVDAEVAALAAYLRIQEARFGSRLRTRLRIDPVAEPRRIASFLLQPLLENAIKHGRRQDGLEVGIDIRATGDGLHVEIENNGTLGSATTGQRRRAGIGLENVRRRLALHYPGRHQFTLGARDDGTAKVIAQLVLEGEPCSGS
jgi:hypothetical protein